MLKKLIVEKYLSLASAEDIGCMKLSAIVSRATNKDYIDIYFILKKIIPLNELLKLAQKKFPEIDTNLILKSLVYFEDVDMEPIMFNPGKEVNFTKVKNFLTKEVKKQTKSFK